MVGEGEGKREGKRREEMERERVRVRRRREEMEGKKGQWEQQENTRQHISSRGPHGHLKGHP